MKKDLYELIQSLSQTEKRYFKMAARKGGTSAKDKNYLLLFDAINKQKIYNEKYLKGQNYVKHLSKEKTYLYDSILKALRQYRSEKSADIQIKDLLIDADFLYERNLLGQTKRILKKAKELAYKYEKNSILLEIINRERYLLMNFRGDTFVEELRKLRIERKDLLGKLKMEYDITDVYEEMYFLGAKIGPVKNDSEKAYLDEWIGKLNAHSNKNEVFFAQLRYLQAQGEFSANVRKFKEGLKYAQKVVEWWKFHAHLIKEYPYMYRVSVRNLLNRCFRADNFEIFLENLKVYKTIPTKNLTDKSVIFRNTCHLELLYAMNICDWDVAKKTVQTIKTQFPKHKLEISNLFKINFMMIYFLVSDFNEAYKWCNEVDINKKSQNDLFIYNIAKMFNLILSYELEVNNFSNVLRNTVAYFNKLKNNSKLEFCTLEYFKSLFNKVQSEHKVLLKNFNQQLKELREDKYERKTFGLDEFWFWTESKLKNKSIDQIFRENLQE